MEIRPLTEEWIPAVSAFNARIASTGFRFPENPEAGHFIAVEGDAVRGAYMLRAQEFWLRGARHAAAHYRLPLTEGTIDKTYMTLGVSLLRHALKQQPALYALGMGGLDKPLPRMLKAAGWKMSAVPFLFKVHRPSVFLRHIRAVRTTPLRRAFFDFAAASGLGWVGWRALHRPLAAPSNATVMESFDPWANVSWSATSRSYACMARDASTLDRFYQRWSVIKLRVGDAGWAVVLDTQMRNDKYFGDMRVGTIADCLASPDDAATVMSAATRFLEQRGVDLLVSNQNHPAWVDALRRCGFSEGPSNFALGLSKALAGLLDETSEMHINRGDGDGPIGL